ncbi:MAG: extracellular solute-binding protein [Lachnospiraceae bacterium]|nr:extracellular solute-binding protein [Candidatus Merdinaster equi]
MKLAKKILALGLGASMVLGLAACGNDASTTTTTPGTTTENTGDNTVTPAAETRTIKIGTWYDHYYDSTMSGIEVNPNVTDPERDQVMFDNLKAVEAKYNIRLEFVNLTWDGVQESINTSILAGSPDCDIYESDLSFGIPAALNGYAVNLAEVLPADADVLSDQIVLNKVDCGKTDGSVYLFQQNMGESVLAGTYMMAFNAQMLDEAGLENPNDLYARGEWTWDKWREYLLALTKDTNGDGVTDVYGYGSRFDFLIDNLLMSNGTVIAGGAQENLSSAEVGEVLDFIYKLYNEDHVARPWNADDFNDNQNAYYDGKVACWISAAWIAASNGNNDAALPFSQIWCPWPVGPSGNQDTNAMKKVSSGNAWFIATGAEDPVFVYNVFYDWANWYNGDVAFRDADLTWWEDSAQTEENYKVMEYMGSRGAFDLWNALGLEWDYTELLNGTMTAAQFQQTWKQSVQDALDNFYN